MIYFTRELHKGYQPRSGWERRALKLWARNTALYKAHLQRIRKYIPSRVQAVIKGSLHDAEVLKHTVSGDNFVLQLDCRGTWGKFRGYKIQIIFKNAVVNRFDVPKRAWWLYDELHIAGRRRFRLMALCDSGEMDIEADGMLTKRC